MFKRVSREIPKIGSANSPPLLPSSHLPQKQPSLQNKTAVFVVEAAKEALAELVFVMFNWNEQWFARTENRCHVVQYKWLINFSGLNTQSEPVWGGMGTYREMRRKKTSNTRENESWPGCTDSADFLIEDWWGSTKCLGFFLNGGDCLVISSFMKKNLYRLCVGWARHLIRACSTE